MSETDDARIMSCNASKSKAQALYLSLVRTVWTSSAQATHLIQGRAIQNLKILLERILEKASWWMPGCQLAVQYRARAVQAHASTEATKSMRTREHKRTHRDLSSESVRRHPLINTQYGTVQAQTGQAREQAHQDKAIRTHNTARKEEKRDRRRQKAEGQRDRKKGQEGEVKLGRCWW